ncbi:hypothetical protein AVEN_109464-1 [Araneus ventricosus]|uniref:Uncharacterized protein n=1 Tax=Araneus ventricosus TaxID=182803 RepID=A0A4Y2VFB2_ARAVE|nr:hypothetical protein AVEN_253240-1 [Araneus ventricosus]GBO24119.1 hypothetical protein AVEN_109464-1 [Araneus ventricosus]
MSELSLDVSEVTYHAKCARSIPSQRLHQIEKSPVDKQAGLSNIDIVPNHQQSNGSVVGPRRGVKHCTVQSTTVDEWAFGSESPY